jgi:hypothetical protein
LDEDADDESIRRLVKSTRSRRKKKKAESEEKILSVPARDLGGKQKTTRKELQVRADIDLNHISKLTLGGRF